MSPSYYSKKIVTFLHCKSEEPCFCSYIRPILRLSQIVGNIPVSLECPSSRKTEEKCALKQRIVSFSSVINTGFIIWFAMMFINIQIMTKQYVSMLFSGSDGNIYRLLISLTCAESFAIVLFGRINVNSLLKAWNQLQKLITKEWLDKPRFPKMIKTSAILISIKIMTLGFTYVIFFVIVMQRFCGKSEEIRLRCISSFMNPEWSAIINGLVIFNKAVFAALLFVFSLYIRSLNQELVEKIEEELIVNGGGFDSPYKIERFRKIHLEINDAVKALSDFFGVPAVIICCGSIGHISGGVYWILVHGESMVLDSVNQNIMDDHSGLTLILLIIVYFAFLSLMLILVGGEIMRESGRLPIKVLHRADLAKYDLRTQFQISFFLQSISDNPSHLCIYGITVLRMKFLAAAAINVTTYLLVLIQFKLGEPPELNDRNQTFIGVN